MYLKFYGLSEKPFSQTPDPRFLYWNDSYREALASLRYGIQERKGFLTMIGEAGTGKTTLLRKLLDDLGPDAISVLLFNPNASFEEILEYTLSELGVMVPSGRKLAMLQRLNEFLLAAFAEGKNTILVIDEAQDLETEVLESLRLLSNLETAREKILQIVLSGQPELATRLAQENLRQLKQRIAVRCRLEPLQRSELAEYIRARLRVAGGDEGLFQESALDGIWRFANGIPRLINTVCDNALLVGYALGKRQIDGEVVEEVVQDLSRLDAPAEDASARAERPVDPSPLRPAPPPLPPAAPPPAAAPAKPEGPLAARPEPAPSVVPSSEAPGPRPEAAPPTPPPAPASAREPMAQAAPRASGRRGTERAPSPRGVGTLAAVVGAIGLLAGGVWLGTQLRPAGAPSVTAPMAPESRSSADLVRRSDAPAAPAAMARADHPPVEPPTLRASPPQPEVPSADIPAVEPQPKTVAAEEARPAEPAAPPAQPLERPEPPPANPQVARSDQVVPISPPLAEAKPQVPTPPLTEAKPRVPTPPLAEAKPQVPTPPLAEAKPQVPTPPPVIVSSKPAAPHEAEPPARPSQFDSGSLPNRAPGGSISVPPRTSTAGVEPSRAPRQGVETQLVQDSNPRPVFDGQQILVRPGDTLYQLAWRTYGTANFTTLDMLRAANPDVQDVNRIMAGRFLVFPDPGPGARILESEGSKSVLALTTPVADQAQGVQRKLQEQFGEKVEVEPVTLAEGQRLYRVSLTELHGESQARAIAESLGTILNDPQGRPGS